MKALVCHGPKDLRIEDLPSPTPDADEVLVQVGAGGVCGSDLHYYNHGGFGAVRIREPMILGHEVAGVVAAVSLPFWIFHPLATKAPFSVAAVEPCFSRMMMLWLL